MARAKTQSGKMIQKTESLRLRGLARDDFSDASLYKSQILLLIILSAGGGDEPCHRNI
jgi:hypothetical protein